MFCLVFYLLSYKYLTSIIQVSYILHMKYLNIVIDHYFPIGIYKLKIIYEYTEVIFQRHLLKLLAQCSVRSKHRISAIAITVAPFIWEQSLLKHSAVFHIPSIIGLSPVPVAISYFRIVGLPRECSFSFSIGQTWKECFESYY